MRRSHYFLIIAGGLVTGLLLNLALASCQGAGTNDAKKEDQAGIKPRIVAASEAPDLEIPETSTPGTSETSPVILFDAPQNDPAALTLDLYAAAVPIGGKRNLKLSGIITGRKNGAVVEMNGNGRLLHLGEEVAGYRLVSIEGERVCLEKK